MFVLCWVILRVAEVVALGMFNSLTGRVTQYQMKAMSDARPGFLVKFSFRSTDGIWQCSDHYQKYGVASMASSSCSWTLPF